MLCASYSRVYKNLISDKIENMSTNIEAKCFMKSQHNNRSDTNESIL